MDTDPVVLIDTDNPRTICFLFVMICLENVVSDVGAGETWKRLGFINSGNFTVGCFLRWSASSALESGNILDFKATLDFVPTDKRLLLNWWSSMALKRLTCCQTTRCPDFVERRKVRAVYSTAKSFSSPFPRKERAGGIAAVWRNNALWYFNSHAKKPPLCSNEAGQSGRLPTPGWENCHNMAFKMLPVVMMGKKGRCSIKPRRNPPWSVRDDHAFFFAMKIIYFSCPKHYNVDTIYI